MPRNPRRTLGGDDEEVDRHRTVEDWKRLSIVQLKEKATHYGLSNAGVKNMVVARLHSYFNTNEGVPQVAENTAPILTTLPTTAETVTMSITDLRQILKEASQAKSGNHAPETTGGSLSPASTTVVAPDINAIANQTTVDTTNSNPWPAQSLGSSEPLIPSFNVNNNGGNISTFLHSPISNLPPLSPKLIKTMKDKDYVDLNLLLPSSLYDTTANNSYSLQVTPGSEGAESLSLTQARRTTQKITNLVSWLDAWNIFIRAMVHFHPVLAQELLAYQESFCTFNHSYPFQACYKYDIAFRMNIARNKHLSWARLDEYAFNKFLRCPQPVQHAITCFKCTSIGHFATNCPYQSSSAPKRNFRADTEPKQACCRHFNNYNRCMVPTCTWPHKCSRCGGPHPVTDCQGAAQKF